MCRLSVCTWGVTIAKKAEPAIIQRVSDPIDPAEIILKRNKLRITPVRLSVLATLTKNQSPMSVPEILSKLKGVDTVTVYRTLNTFVRKKIVHRVRGEDRSWLYAQSDFAAAPKHLHPHFVCESCGKVECLEAAEIPASFIASLHVDQRYAVTYPEVVLHGMCPRCK